MLKKGLIVFIIIATIVIAGYKILQTWRPFATDELQTAWPQQIIAIYDTGSNSLIRTNDSVLHYTLVWKNDSEKSLPNAPIIILADKKLPLFINLQIWSKSLIKNFDKSVEALILNGDFDKKLIEFYKLLANCTSPIYLRFNSEMEIPIFKYPWQYQAGMQYIQSFRHIATLCKKYSPNVKIVWGPAGYPGAEAYWPGDEFVDLVSINLNKAPDLENAPYPPYSSLSEMMSRKLFRMRFINKPVLLLGTESFSRETLKKQMIDELNEKLAVDKAIYRIPVLPPGPGIKTERINQETNIKVGVYDPLLLLVNNPKTKVEHLFPNIGTVKNGAFKKEFDAVIARHHDVIVTMEAWRDENKEKDSAILNNTIAGLYDKVWSDLYAIISNVPQTVYLRWGHEMEIPVDRYPWQKQDPVTYIKAFRYFATFQHPRAGNIKIVWGPAGDRGCVEWWPGDDVVDFVSIAIYGLPDKNINDYNKQHSFSSILENKFQRLRFINKPVFITEFGVKGPESYQKKWLEEAAETINRYPQIIGVSYFNFADSPKAWGDAETPDWSITAATFNSFTGLLQYQRKQ